MTPPTLGITILIILSCTILGQLLLQRAERKRFHRELLERLDRLAQGRGAGDRPGGKP